ncbi:MAG: hypothetical protein AAB916_01930 [Patescibacteria group bacterium]
MPQKPQSFSRSFVEGELALGFWAFAKKAAGALDSFLILRVFTLYQFGAYQLLLSFYAILSDVFHDVFGEVAGTDLARLAGSGEEAKAKRLFCEYALFRLCMAAIPSLVLFSAAPLVAAYMGYGDEAIAVLRIMAFLFVLDAVILLFTMLLKLRLRFTVLAPRATVQKLVQLAVLSVFFFSGRLGLREVFLSQIAGSAGAILLMAPAIRASLMPWRGVSAVRATVLWPAIRAHGKWALPQPLLTDLTAKVRPWLIRAFLNTEAVGLFGVAYTFFSALKDFLPIRTPGALVPRHIGDPIALDRFYRRGTKYYIWTACALALAGAAGVPVVIWLFFPAFVPAIPLFLLLLPGLPLFAFTKPMTFLLVAHRRQKFLLFQSALQTSVSLLLLVVLLPVASMMGIVAAEVLAAFANAGVRYRYLASTGAIGRFSFRSLVAVDAEDKNNIRSLARQIADVLPFKKFV